MGGMYINPSDMSKEHFLAENGMRVSLSQAKQFMADPCDCHKVCCLVDNGAFTAAAICFDEDEFKAFVGAPDDTRPKAWFIVGTEELAPYMRGSN